MDTGATIEAEGLHAKFYYVSAVLNRQCLPDLNDPICVARMVMFLASDEAAMCTANSYIVEAGSI